MDKQNQSNLPEISEPVEAGGVIDQLVSVAPAGWRMRFAKAAAQLIAGTQRGAAAYGEVRERLDTIDGRTKVSNALAEAVAKQAVNDPELMERAKARFLGTAFQKQQNLEAVIVGASEQLLALPAPNLESASENAEIRFHDSESQGEHDVEPLNPDWATSFSNIAENATSEELRSRLARILAGELASPGTFSRATVRLISELERPDLEAMQNVLPYVLGDIIVRSRSEPSMPNHEMMLALAEVGLLTDASGMLSKTWPVATGDGMPIGVAGREWILAISLKSGLSFALPMAQLTRAGVAVVDLLGRPDERPVLRQIAKEVPAGSFSKIVMGRCMGKDRIGHPIEQLFPEIPTYSMPPMAHHSPFAPPNIPTS